jgi:PKD domain
VNSPVLFGAVAVVAALFFLPPTAAGAPSCSASAHSYVDFDQTYGFDPGCDTLDSDDGSTSASAMATAACTRSLEVASGCGTLTSSGTLTLTTSATASESNGSASGSVTFACSGSKTVTPDNCTNALGVTTLGEARTTAQASVTANSGFIQVHVDAGQYTNVGLQLSGGAARFVNGTYDEIFPATSGGASLRVTAFGNVNLGPGISGNASFTIKSVAKLAPVKVVDYNKFGSWNYVKFSAPDGAKILITGLSFGQSGVADPVLELRDASGKVIAINNNWTETQQNEIANTGFAPPSNTESAILVSVPPGTYTVIEEGNCGNKGSGEIRIYDLFAAPGKELVGSKGWTVTTGKDSDGDSLPDEWERSGLTIDAGDACFPGDVSIERGGEFIDLRAMGSDPMQKDIFVHADWMAAQLELVFQPARIAMKWVMEAFATAPVDNPDGRVGVNLHIDSGPTSIMNPKTLEAWNDLSEAGEVPYQNKITSSDLDAVKSIHFTPSKRFRVFRYAIFSDALAYNGGCNADKPDTVTGIAPESPGTSMLLGMGSFYRFLKTELAHKDPELKDFVLAEAGTFMHELGHTLGLRHGGTANTSGPPFFGDGSQDRNYKPNYLSVMNYRFHHGLFNRDGSRGFDYSRRVLPVLDPEFLNEMIGIQDPEGHQTTWGPKPPLYSDYRTHLLPSSALDWNQNRTLDSTRVSFNIVADPCGTIDNNMLPVKGDEDWSRLNYSANGKLGVAGVQKGSPMAQNISDTDSGPENDLPIDEIVSMFPPGVLEEAAVAPSDVVTLSKHTGQAPLSIEFDGSASTAVNAVVKEWLWEFGDGTNGSGPTVSHTYSAPGTYFGRLKVVDDKDRINLISSLYRIDVISPAQLANIATRLSVGAGDNVLIGGFIVTGPAGAGKTVLIRGVAPSLAQFGVPNTLPDPYLELHKPDGSVVANDNWGEAPNKDQIPNGLTPGDPRESIILATLTPGNYTAVLRGAHGETGIGLAEVYDLDAVSAARLANISTRGFADTDDNVMIGGFIVGGTESGKVLVRAIGPTLTGLGVPGAISNPVLEVHDSNGGVFMNEGWRSTQESEIIATTIPPNNDHDSAVLLTLPPGNYTAIVRGANNTTGVGLVEAYNLQ